MSDFNIEINEVTNLPPDWFKKVKAWLAGNKSIIGLALLNILQVVKFSDPYYTIVCALISLITGVSLIDHAKKGFFTTKKGS
jgi:hypothetical protein